MNKKIRFFNLGLIKKSQRWINDHLLGVVIFNFVLSFLMLLHSAGYFAPFFPITVNVIVMVCILMAVTMLNVNSSIIFVITILFWIFAGILKLLGIDIWAERTGLYVYQSLILGVCLTIIEVIKDKINAR